MAREGKRMHPGTAGSRAAATAAVPHRRVTAGLGLFLGGLALGALALVVFLSSSALAVSDPAFWPAREAAFATAAVGLPVFLLGVVLLLPVDGRPAIAAASGGLLCLVAVLVFVWAYPTRWDLVRSTDATAPAVGLYAVGLGAIAASTWSGLRRAVGAAGRNPPRPADEPTRRSVADGTGEPGAGTPPERGRGAEAASLSDCLRRLFDLPDVEEPREDQ